MFIRWFSKETIKSWFCSFCQFLTINLTMADLKPLTCYHWKWNWKDIYQSIPLYSISTLQVQQISLKSISIKKLGNDVFWVKVWVAQSCLTLCNPMDCSLPGSSVHGILQARMLEWVAILFCRDLWPRDWTRASCIAGRSFTIWVHACEVTAVVFNSVRPYGL